MIAGLSGVVPRILTLAETLKAVRNLRHGPDIKQGRMQASGTSGRIITNKKAPDRIAVPGLNAGPSGYLKSLKVPAGQHLACVEMQIIWTQ
jgi:hypothetical protein